MKKMIKQIAVVILLLACMSCTDEKNEIISQEMSQNSVYKLPKNAKELLTPYYSRRNSVNNNLLTGTKNVVYFEKVFVLYPANWDVYDKQAFALQQKQNTYNGRTIFIANEGCKYVDTWFIGHSSPPKNKGKNLIVASDPTVSDGEEETEEGPGGCNNCQNPVHYNSCDEVPIPENHHLIPSPTPTNTPISTPINTNLPSTDNAPQK